MIKKLTRQITIVSLFAFVALTATTASAQSSTPLELPKIEEAKHIGISFANDGRGRIRGADKTGMVRQYLEIWANEKQLPNIVTYVLIGDGGQTFTATWGRGPVNSTAFTCQADKLPEFGEKSVWVAMVNDGALVFQEINDDAVKGVFDNLIRARRDYGREVNANFQRSNANTTEINLLTFFKEKNRKKWAEQGWLHQATTCVQHL
ncbi:MAG: hypothetical protein H7Y30_05305 [Pyrinomonadaceae bacterium]|nr:hypothetical protein [Pyrinomonadaceae bacterium]